MTTTAWLSAGGHFQAVIYDRLVAHAGVGDVAGDRIYDGPPEGRDFPCITFGPRQLVNARSDYYRGWDAFQQLDCWSRDQGRLGPVSDLAGLVADALDHWVPPADGLFAVTALSVRDVQVRTDPDGITGHGIVSIVARVEQSAAP